MAKANSIVVYTKDNCPFCVKAKALIKGLGFKYEEKNLKEFESPEAMIKDIGENVRSMPQIKINDELVGGYNQLIEHYYKQGLVDFKGNKISE